MSLESVNARVADLQARIQSLGPNLPDDPLPAPVAGSRTGFQPSSSPTGVAPFDVSFEQAMGRARVRPITGRFRPDIETLIDKYSALNGLNPDVVRAVINAESSGNPRELSRKGAMGLMQLMPEEVAAYGIKDPYDPEQNIMGGTRQLAEKLRIFNGDLKLALAAYNAGTNRVKQYNGVPPFKETQDYVNKIMSELGR